jgi:hypothetical protein
MTLWTLHYYSLFYLRMRLTNHKNAKVSISVIPANITAPIIVPMLPDKHLGHVLLGLVQLQLHDMQG